MKALLIVLTLLTSQTAFAFTIHVWGENHVLPRCQAQKYKMMKEAIVGKVALALEGYQWNDSNYNQKELSAWSKGTLTISAESLFFGIEDPKAYGLGSMVNALYQTKKANFLEG